VSSWDDQVALFSAGIEKYGRIDAVVINAGDPSNASPPKVSTNKTHLRSLPEEGRCLHLHEPSNSPSCETKDVHFGREPRGCGIYCEIGAVLPPEERMGGQAEGDGRFHGLDECVTVVSLRFLPFLTLAFLVSIAGLNGVPKIEIYTASKHGVCPPSPFSPPRSPFASLRFTVRHS